MSDGNGVILEKRAFDAWGVVLSVQNGSGQNLSGFQVFDRGYTGHEHLQGVGLIHMNGRLYDPKLHRFLSPDNFVQDPSNSQSYNRYGYALNNPLKYTDPSGEVLPAIVVAIIIGASVNVGVHVISSLISNTPLTLGGIAGAALVGAAKRNV